MLRWFPLVSAIMVLALVDSYAVAMVGLGALAVVLTTLGYLTGRWVAILLAAGTILGALVADGLWALDVAPFDRDDETESLPSTFSAVLVYAPVGALLVGVGVAVSKLRGSRQTPEG